MEILWWILGTAGGLLLLYLFTLWFSAMLISMEKEYNTASRVYRILLYSATWVVLTSSHIRYKVSGREKIPTEGRFLLVSNHRSGYDPMVTYFALREHDISFIAKPSIFKIPVFGRMIHRLGFYSIDRDDPRQAMKDLMKATEWVKNDQGSMGVYPEGTRSADGKLLPFHYGVLKVAQKAGVPVVVAALQGTEKIKKNAPWRKTVVQIDILETIPADQVIAERSTALGEKTYDIIKRYLEGERTDENTDTV